MEPKVAPRHTSLAALIEALRMGYARVVLPLATAVAAVLRNKWR
jgi:hypothetical protein